MAIISYTYPPKSFIYICCLQKNKAKPTEKGGGSDLVAGVSDLVA